MRKKWKVAPPAPRSYLDRFPSLPPLLAQILYNRKLTDPAEARLFLSNQWPEHDVLALSDMARALDILIRAIRRKEKIAVYGDFDADGVTATALLVQTLTALGADVMPYIPRRVDEGYGLNLRALRWLFGQGVRVVVTVDCGIRAHEEIEQARRGLEFVVTDHHSVGKTLPFASAVINPKREDNRYPFRDLAGVGVAFKLAQGLIHEAADARIPVHIEESALLDLVAIGTVADLVPLQGENRALVVRGLQLLNAPRREGIRALLRASGLRPGEVNAAAISFGLGPRLNAAGRLGDATLSYELLISADPAEAGRLSERLNEQNRRRKALTEQAYERAQELALSRGEDAPLFYAADASFAPGIVGLVAGRLTEAYYRPAIVVECGDQECKGSCRSISEFHITNALDECSDLLLRHGGHAAAAGFTVSSDRLDELVERLFAIASRELSAQELVPTLQIDADVALADLDWALAEWLGKLEPCGYDNPTPLFLSRNVPVLQARAVGSEGQHLRLTLGADRETRDAIAFRMGERLAELGEQVDVAYYLEINQWNGERRLQLNVQDIRPAAQG